MSKVDQIEAELRELSQFELRQMREWLDDVIEDEPEFTPEFEQSIRQTERDIAQGKSARVPDSNASFPLSNRFDRLTVQRFIAHLLHCCCKGFYFLL
jgi:hypothetical protein